MEKVKGKKSKEISSKELNDLIVGLIQDRKGKEIIAKTPAERETVKLPQGQVVNLMNNVIQANE